MATNTLLISQTQFIDQTGNDRVWSNPQFRAELVAFHETALQDLLDSCATGLQDRTVADTLTAADNALLDRLRPYIAYKALELYTYRTAVDATALGVGNDVSEMWQPASAAARNMAGRSYADKAKAYLDRMLQFLKDNRDDYPCFVENTHLSSADTYVLNTMTTTDNVQGVYPVDAIYPYNRKPSS